MSSGAAFLKWFARVEVSDYKPHGLLVVYLGPAWDRHHHAVEGSQSQSLARSEKGRRTVKNIH